MDGNHQKTALGILSGRHLWIAPQSPAITIPFLHPFLCQIVSQNTIVENENEISAVLPQVL
jgi:hypothetical protein